MVILLDDQKRLPGIHGYPEECRRRLGKKCHEEGPEEAHVDYNHPNCVRKHTQFTRRKVLFALGAASIIGPAQERDVVLERAIERNDAAVRRLLDAQITGPASPWRGGIADEFGLHAAGSAGGLTETMAASFVHPQSKFHGDPALVERIRLAAGFLERSQNRQGNVDLLSTNFNSPPDTGFVTNNVAAAAAIAKLHGAAEITGILRPFLLKGAAAMAEGGIHTPNHRWVVCSALAQVNELFPNTRYTNRIAEWLAEGIDIDGDGQFTERSTLTYNRVTDRALVVMAVKLKRPELLDPVRRNLRAMLYLLHADGEVVTEISRRQDQNTRGNMGGYWFPLAYLAIRDGDGQFAAMARQFAPDHASLSALLEYPELSQPLPESRSLPSDFEKRFPEVGITRIRRGPLSATLVLGDSSRFFTLRYGDAVINAVRFATSFFGKGQFVPAAAERRGNSYVFRQSLEGPYYQPLPRRITNENWASARRDRRQTEVCRLEQSAEITEVKNGFRMRVQAQGTDGVPLAVEISFREGGGLEGCQPAPQNPEGFVLAQGTGVYRAGRNTIRFGPGVAPHQYTQLRGAEPKLPGQSVYITGSTPFDHTIHFECG